MKNNSFTLILVIFFLQSGTIRAQQNIISKMNIATVPDSCELYIDGSLYAVTPCKFKYNFNFKSNSEYIFEFRKSGYVSKQKKYSFVDNRPSKVEEVTIQLERNRNKIDSISECLLNISKIGFNLSFGDKIGFYRDLDKNKKDELLWDNNLLNNIDYSSLRKIANEELDKAHLPVRPEDITKEDDEKTEIELIAKIKNVNFNFNLKYKKYVGDGFEQKYSNKEETYLKLNIEWQLLDKQSETIIATIEDFGIGKVLNEPFFGMGHKTFNFISQDLLTSTIKDAIINLTYNDSFIQVINGFKKLGRTNVSSGKITINKYNFVVKPNELVSKSMKSCVSIIGSSKLGSGFVISENGFILTNYHVVEKNKSIQVKFDNGLILPAEVVAYNQEFDVAAIKVIGSGYSPLQLNSYDSCKIGEEVIAIGTPADIKLGQTVTKGIISGKREINKYSYLQTDVSVNPGNSGGPLINSKGQVVGIITWGLGREGYQGLNFAIPTYVAIEKLGIELIPSKK